MIKDDIYFDQYDYEIDENLYPILKRMRDEAPVWYNEKYDYWTISRYEDVLQASRDTTAFSSSYKTVLELMTDKPHQSSMIINTDPPYHKMLRDIVAPFFTPAKIAALEDDIRQIVVSYLEPLEDKIEFDFVEDFARWIPMDAVSTLLDVPIKDRRQINIWGNDLLHRDEGQTEPGKLQIAASEGLDKYFADFMQAFRTRPNNTLSSAIVNTTVNDNGVERSLTDVECIEYFHLIAAAGNETVARLLGSAAWLLGTHPEQRKLVSEDPKRLPKAIEEMLRFEAPSPVQFRRTLKDVELHGQLIPAGSNICLMTASAGRDEREYEQADKFDVEQKKNRRHLSFGYGIHSCLGAWLARLEIRIALEEFLKRFPDWEVDTENMQRVRTSTVRGYSHIPIKITSPQ